MVIGSELSKNNCNCLQASLCATVTLALVNSTDVVTQLSNLTCTLPRAPDVLLCKKPEDMLVVGLCVQLEKDLHHIRFKPTERALEEREGLRLYQDTGLR